jgi:restriction system protein
MSRRMDEPTELTPEQFEREVEKQISAMGVSLSEFKVRRLERIPSADGVYEIDVTARFEALGANFLVLIECKHHKNPIKREVVQVLNDRLRAVGAQKGMIFSTAQYQRGALEYAKTHGIALARVVDGSVLFESKSFGGRRVEPPPWAPPYAAYLVSLSDEGGESYSLMREGLAGELLEQLNVRGEGR